jgi:cytochrome b6-f complex iron-sulfur subunit
MSLHDDTALPLSDEERSRRRFLAALGTGALAAAALGTGITGLRFLEPSVFFEEDTRVGVGRPDDIAPGTVLVLAKQRLYVVRTPEGFYALSATCTHLGCTTRYDKDAGRIACPCHGSRFALDGHVAQGPAPRPLPRVEITLERGVLVVDSAKRVAPDAILKVA